MTSDPICDGCRCEVRESELEYTAVGKHCQHCMQWAADMMFAGLEQEEEE
jgi:hypothetical protein